MSNVLDFLRIQSAATDLRIAAHVRALTAPGKREEDDEDDDEFEGDADEDRDEDDDEDEDDYEDDEDYEDEDDYEDEADYDEGEEEQNSLTYPAHTRASCGLDVSAKCSLDASA